MNLEEALKRIKELELEVEEVKKLLEQEQKLVEKEKSRNGKLTKDLKEIREQLESTPEPDKNKKEIKKIDYNVFLKR